MLSFLHLLLTPFLNCAIIVVLAIAFTSLPKESPQLSSGQLSSCLLHFSFSRLSHCKRAPTFSLCFFYPLLGLFLCGIGGSGLVLDLIFFFFVDLLIYWLLLLFIHCSEIEREGKKGYYGRRRSSS